MTEALSKLTFAIALLLYGASSALFYASVVRPPQGAPASKPGHKLDAAKAQPPAIAARLLGLGALAHAGYVAFASFVAHVCPIHSVHFILSVASLFATAAYLTWRRRTHVEALGLVVAPLGLAFLLGTFFLGTPGPEPKLSPIFITLHVLANLVGDALFLLAGASAALYLVQERRIKEKRHLAKLGALPSLDTLDRAVHRFLLAGFPLLTLGVVSGTYWARKLEAGSPNEVMRTVLGYATWLLIAGVLLLRAAAGWRGKRAAYGTIAGLACAAAVLVIYVVRPGPSMSAPPSLQRSAPALGEGATP